MNAILPYAQIRRPIAARKYLLIEKAEMARCSLPVPFIRDGRPIERVFLTDVTALSPEKNLIHRPYAWLEADAGTGHIIFYARCEHTDFVDTGRFPLDTPIGNTVPAISKEAFIAAHEALDAAYETVRVSYFGGVGEQARTSAQREAAERYRQSFFQVVRHGLYPYYLALSPDFFRWMGMARALGDTAPPAAPDAPDAPDAYRLLNELRTLFTKKIMQDENKQTMFDNMHRELVAFRNDANLRPLIDMAMDLMLVLDDTERSLARAELDEQARGESAVKLLRGLRDDLKDTLVRAGFEELVCPGDTPDARRQRISGYEETDDPALANRVAKRLGSGYELNGKIIRPERIHIYRMKQP